MLSESHPPEVGEATLTALATARRYASWQLEQFQPYIGRRVCEVGSGIGNISAMLAAMPLDYLLLTDSEPDYVMRLRQRFATDARIEVAQVTLPVEEGSSLAHRHLDTVVAFNVLEHIERDVAALRSIHELLMVGGHVLMLVPAHRRIYSDLDALLGHYRRYSRASARRALNEAGFSCLSAEYFNMTGAIGWWWYGTILRRKQLSQKAVAAFDKLVPLLRHERHVRRPIGLSVLAVGRRS